MKLEMKPEMSQEITSITDVFLSSMSTGLLTTMVCYHIITMFGQGGGTLTAIKRERTHIRYIIPGGIVPYDVSPAYIIFEPPTPPQPSIKITMNLSHGSTRTINTRTRRSQWACCLHIKELSRSLYASYVRVLNVRVHPSPPSCIGSQTHYDMTRAVTVGDVENNTLG